MYRYVSDCTVHIANKVMEMQIKISSNRKKYMKKLFRRKTFYRNSERFFFRFLMIEL